jgi:hypothetical protein
MPISSVFISERWILHNYLDIKLLQSRARRPQIQNEFGFRRLTAHPAYPILSPSLSFFAANHRKPSQKMATRHVVFEISQAEDGTWSALGIGDDIFTEGGDFEELKVNAVEAIRAHFSGENCDKFEVRLAQILSQFMFAA